MPKKPTFHYERELRSQGYFVVGIDEAGCGCLAGPVVAAAVHLPLNSRIAELTDSKLLSSQKREEIFELFLERGMKFSVSMADQKEVDRLNIRRASLLAMERAAKSFLKNVKIDMRVFALVDAWTIPNLQIPQRGIIHGDRIVKSIAAASIIAKVARDRLMEEYDREFPQYCFGQHKGYATALHRAKLLKYGPCILHRRTFLKKSSIAA